jgi:hypothetical protein
MCSGSNDSIEKCRNSVSDVSTRLLMIAVNCCLQVACTASCADNDREDNIETLCKRDTVCAQRTAALGFVRPYTAM